MAVTTQSIINECRILLHDAAGTRWPNTELIGWINEAQRKIVDLDDNAGEVTANALLIPGVNQTLPANGIRIGSKPIKARDMGIGGATPGQQIHEASEEVLSLYNPGWASVPGNVVPEQIMRNINNERSFFIYPAQPAGAASQATIELSYIAAPIDVVLAGNISLNDRYREPIRDMTLGYAFMKEDETQDLTKAGSYFKAAMISLGLGGK